VTNRQLVHVIDDDPALLHSVGLLLSTEGYGVKTYNCAEDFLQNTDENETGVVVTDVQMKGISGVELLSRMKDRGLHLPVVVISAYANIPLAVQAMKQGAIDLLEKPFRADVLMSSVKHAFARGAGAAESPEAQECLARFASLSTRENEVLDGLLRGQPNKIIAHEMGISQRTVEIHRANLMKKTQAGSLAELVRLALSVSRP
jgi:two-component system response regulator FixJ